MDSRWRGNDAAGEARQKGRMGSRQPLFPVQLDGVTHCRGDLHDRHAGNGNAPSEVKRPVPEKINTGMWPEPDCDVSQPQQNTNFGGAKFEERKPEDAKCVRRQIDLDGKHQECDQHSGRNSPVDGAGKGEPSDQEKRSEDIGHVVNVETVARPLPVSESRQSSVQAVSQPVQRQKECRQNQPQRVQRASAYAAPTRNMETKPSSVRWSE